MGRSRRGIRVFFFFFEEGGGWDGDVKGRGGGGWRAERGLGDWVYVLVVLGVDWEV
jgi:hypothetical protein